MSDEAFDDLFVLATKTRLQHIPFADRVQMIHKLLKLIVETLDGMEAEVKRECP